MNLLSPDAPAVWGDALLKELKMQIRIESNVQPQALKFFLEENSLKVPVFFDRDTRIVLTINPRNRADAIKLIDWLMTQ